MREEISKKIQTGLFVVLILLILHALVPPRESVLHDAVITEISGSSIRLNYLHPIDRDHTLYADRSDFRTRPPMVGDTVYVIPRSRGNLFIQTLF